MSKKKSQRKPSEFEILLEIIREQQRTHREWITTLQFIAETVVKAVDRADARESKNQNERFKESVTHQCESAKDQKQLPTPALVSKSGASAKHEREKGSGSR